MLSKGVSHLDIKVIQRTVHDDDNDSVKFNFLEMFTEKLDPQSVKSLLQPLVYQPESGIERWGWMFQMDISSGLKTQPHFSAAHLHMKQTLQPQTAH